MKLDEDLNLLFKIKIKIDVDAQLMRNYIYVNKQSRKDKNITYFMLKYIKRIEETTQCLQTIEQQFGHLSNNEIFVPF